MNESENEKTDGEKVEELIGTRSAVEAFLANRSEKVAVDMFPKSIGKSDVVAFKCLPRGSTRPHEGWIKGRHYVLKCGSYSSLSSDEHVHNEFVADELLRAAGCLVPASREYRADIGHGKVETIRLSEYIENGMMLAEAWWTIDSKLW